jgi:hypothetical protein
MRVINKYGFIFISIIMFGCDINDDTDYTEFVYRNESSHYIEVEAFNNANSNVRIRTFDLNTGEEEIFLQQPENWTGPLEIPPFFGTDSVITIFDDTLAITFEPGRLDGNPMRIDNYKLLEGEEDPYVYLFEFTNEDYERALERGRVIN